MYEFLLGVVIGVTVTGFMMAVLNMAGREDALMDDWYVRGLIEDVANMDTKSEDMLLSLKKRASKIVEKQG